ncbi:MAG: helix-turn-helix transcriptional regulator [Oscillospiraceae bacterium]|nr:helix-turn-helix transcriptional regulator [Oscillospiraceae bacterium]
MSHGECLLFDLDWDKNEMRLREVRGDLFSLAGKALQYSADFSAKITPLVYTLRALAEAGGNEFPAHFALEAVYDQQTFSLRLQRTDDYASVVDVPRERQRTLLSHLLTPRETEIATLLFEGRTIRYIAGTRHIAEGTVKRIIYNVYQKMNVGSQVELIREIYIRLAESHAQPKDRPPSA